MHSLHLHTISGFDLLWLIVIRSSCYKYPREPLQGFIEQSPSMSKDPYKILIVDSDLSNAILSPFIGKSCYYKQYLILSSIEPKIDNIGISCLFMFENVFSDSCNIFFIHLGLYGSLYLLVTLGFSLQPYISTPHPTLVY